MEFRLEFICDTLQEGLAYLKSKAPIPEYPALISKLDAAYDLAKELSEERKKELENERTD